MNVSVGIRVSFKKGNFQKYTFIVGDYTCSIITYHITTLRIRNNKSELLRNKKG